MTLMPEHTDSERLDLVQEMVRDGSFPQFVQMWGPEFFNPTTGTPNTLTELRPLLDAIIDERDAP